MQLSRMQVPTLTDHGRTLWVDDTPFVYISTATPADRTTGPRRRRPTRRAAPWVVNLHLAPPPPFKEYNRASNECSQCIFTSSIATSPPTVQVNTITMPAIKPGSLVLVTGASGFIAAWVISPPGPVNRHPT